MNRHFNKLTPGELERVALLAEECAEVIQVCGKILRHGYESYHPDGGPDNRGLLHKELGDVQAAIKMMSDAGDIADCSIQARKQIKLENVKQYLHHQAISDSEA